MDAPSKTATSLPDAARVEALAGFGLSAEDIAQLFDIKEAVVHLNFRTQLASGQIKANARVAESLYRKAIGEGRESVTAAIFWLKTRARWREHSVHTLVTGAGQAQIQSLSDAELENIILTLSAQIEVAGGSAGPGDRQPTE